MIWPSTAPNLMLSPQDLVPASVRCMLPGFGAAMDQIAGFFGSGIPGLPGTSGRLLLVPSPRCNPPCSRALVHDEPVQLLHAASNVLLDMSLTGPCQTGLRHAP